jgi:hypothetical protein
MRVVRVWVEDAQDLVDSVRRQRDIGDELFALRKAGGATQLRLRKDDRSSLKRRSEKIRKDY